MFEAQNNNLIKTKQPTSLARLQGHSKYTGRFLPAELRTDVGRGVEEDP